MTAEEHLLALRSILDNLQNQVDDTIAELASRQAQISESLQTLSSMDNELREKQEKVLVEKAKLEKDVKPLRVEKLRLEEEISSDVTKKADLKIENVRLAEENGKLKTYEEKAWKVLRAKENELIEREKTLEQRESLRPNNKSLLPPIHE